MSQITFYKGLSPQCYSYAKKCNSKSRDIATAYSQNAQVGFYANTLFVVLRHGPMSLLILTTPFVCRTGGEKECGFRVVASELFIQAFDFWSRLMKAYLFHTIKH